jgi:hypothetical protein
MAKAPYNPNDPLRIGETLKSIGIDTSVFAPQGVKPQTPVQPSMGGKRFYQGPSDIGVTQSSYSQPAASAATGQQKIQGLMGLLNQGALPMGGQGQPEGPEAPGGGGGGGRSNLDMLNEMFNPLFENLSQREEAANKRYEANAQQVTNIYGQITNARTADIGTTATAFQRLADAAATRSSAVNTQIDESEAARLRNNQAALESMGLAGLSTPQGDIASQGAAMAQNTNRLNSENWQGLLSAMGVNAQDIARSDVTGFNYRMGEDLGQLRGAREQFAQDIDQQRAQLVSQKAQATFEYQQAQQRAAAAAAAAQQRAAFESQDRQAKLANDQMANALKASGPLIYTVSQMTGSGQLSQREGTNVMNVITEWSQNVPSPGGKGWKASTAANSILAAAGSTLSGPERNAIIGITSNMFPAG